MKRKQPGQENAPHAGVFESAVLGNSPVSIWEEDFSAVKSFFNDLKEQGITDIETYFRRHPDALQHCAELVRIIDVNRAALVLHGAASKEELLAGLTHTFTPESFDAFRRELVCLWNGDTHMSADAVIKTLAGEPRYVTVYFSVCTGHEATYSRAIVSLIDITERKRAEDALSASETDRRAPLRHIDGFMELLQKSSSDALDGQSIHYMTPIKDAAKRMALLIDDLLALSRTGRLALSKTKVDLQDMAREVVDDFAHETTGRTIGWHIHDLPVVSADRTLMRAVLDNLFSNATKFTRPRAVAEIEIGSCGQHAESVIFVRDNGVGFDMKYVDKLFGVFQRLHKAEESEGTGIGLANAHRISARHGGRTWRRPWRDVLLFMATFHFRRRSILAHKPILHARQRRASVFHGNGYLGKWVRGSVCLTLCLLSIGGNPCFGAGPFQPVFTDPLLEPWRWQVYPDLSGLSTQCIAEDVHGTIWFGEARGAWSFDGVEWTHYPPEAFSGSSVTSICQAKDGRLYAAANQEISRFDGHQWEPLLHESGLLPEGVVRKIAADGDGSLWVASSKGLLHYRQSTWTLYTGAEFAQRLHSSPTPSSGRIEQLPVAAQAKMRTDSPAAGRYDFSDVCVDRQGRIWLGTEAGEVLCFDPPSVPSAVDHSPVAEQGKWSVYNETDGMVCGRRPAILAAQDGRIWVVYGADSSHANVFDGKTWSTVDLAEVGMPQDCGNLLQTRDGVIWVSGRYVVGALRDGQWRTYKKPEVPIPSARNFLMQASDGALWMGGPGTVIMRVDYQTPRWLTVQDLNFQWESPSGVQWFLHRDGRVVVHDAGQWTGFGAGDGVIDAPVALLGTRSGGVWVAGSHEHIAATARYDGRQWTRTIHAELSWGIDERGVMESSDGSVWFSATVDSSGPSAHRAGILQYRNGEWIHHHQPGRTPSGGHDDDSMSLLPALQNPETIGKFYCLGESGDGKIWAGRNDLILQDRLGWHKEPPLSNMPHRVINRMYTSSDGALWMSTLQFGALRYHNGVWRVFQGKGQLEANSVYSIAETSDGSIWAATDRGFSRYDGRTWTPSPLPEAMNIPLDGGDLKTSSSNSLWINRRAREWNYRAWPRLGQTVATNCEFWTVCHQFQGIPPQTFISMGSEKVSPPGNLEVSWGGTVPWRPFKDAQLHYSFRLDDREWSVFSPEAGHSFFTLPVGRHRLEVRARDQDFNVDPTPAALDFVVLPPVWRQIWFILLVSVLVGLVLAQSLRVALERSQLRQLTVELDQRVSQRTALLETANNELEAFSYSVSHDLRAPLRHIDGFMELLQKRISTTLDEQSIHYMTTIKDAVKRMGMLIDDLLALSQMGRHALSKTKVDVQALAQEVVEDFAHETTGRTIHWHIHDLPVISADKSLMRTVLTNLISNAIKFTRPRAVAEIEIGSYRQAAESILFVRDNGVGFDMKYVEKLFGVFQRLHRADEFDGTGIGLANVHRIITRHGGQIWAEAELDKGATFYFSLPSLNP